jgi:5-methylthioadenosine/S-adenosylhomocysteine deaminase
MAILIKGALLHGGKKADLLTEGNKIAKIAPSITASAEEKIDASGKLLLPGFINTHTHSGMSILRGIGDDLQLHDWLWKKVRPAEQKICELDMHAASLLSCAEMMRSGTTCFSDMYFHMDSVAGAVKESGMRAMLGYGMVDMGDEKTRKRELAIAEKFIRNFDGTAGGRIKCTVVPHAPYTCSKELLQASSALAKKYKTRLHIHVSETRKEVFDSLNKTKMRPVDYLASLGMLTPGTIAAHCVWLTKQEVGVLAKHGVHVSYNPVSNMKLASGGAAPIPEMLEAGVNVTLGTDGVASNNSYSMFECMKFGALLQKQSRWDAQAVNAKQALQFATLNGAKALGINAGEIKEGKLADFILLDLRAPNMQPVHSIESNVVYSAHAGNVTDTIIDGKLVMRNRKILTFDEEKAIDAAQKAAERISSA